MERNSFLFYRSFYDAVCDLPDEQFVHAMRAILEYAIYGKEYSGDDNMTKVIFRLIRPQLDANNQKWENGKKGGEYGKLGGRPKKTPPPPGGENCITPNEDCGVILENPKETPPKPQGNPNLTPNVECRMYNAECKMNNALSQKKESARAKKIELPDFNFKASNEDFLSENFEKNDFVTGKERAREQNFEELSLSKKASNENFLSENFEKNDVVTGKERAREKIFEELPQIQKNADNENFSNEKLQKNEVVTGKESERESESAKNWGAAANFNAKSTDNENITPKKQSIDDVQKEFEATSHYEALVMQRGINKQQARDALRIFVSDCKLRGDMMMDMREFRVRFSKLLPYLVKEIKANNNSTNNIAKGW